MAEVIATLASVASIAECIKRASEFAAAYKKYEDRFKLLEQTLEGIKIGT